MLTDGLMNFFFFFLMIRPPPKSTLMTHSFPTRRASDLNKDSRLNVLIGSRKFTEGWSSWRVSTMGLLNMGQGEGSQIIQLFGRGVRLKGKGFRSEEHTSELQSLMRISYAVFCLKKKNN